MSLQRKIWIVCGAGYVSGKEIVSFTLGEGLRQRGHDVRFMTSRWSNGDFPRRLSAGHFPNKILPLGFISMKLNPYAVKGTLHQLVLWPALVSGFISLAGAMDQHTVIHTNWHHALLLLPFLDRNRDIFWVHEVVPKSTRYARVFGAIARRSGCIVCVSEAVARSLEAIDVPPDRLVVVHNGVKLPAEVAPRGTQDVLRFGIVGQIGEWKGHDDAFDALRILAGRGERIALKIFGAGNDAYVALLRRKAMQLGVGPMVDWCGYFSNRDEMFSELDVVLAPSRWVEPFGMSALEAAAFGRPVICSSQGGLPEIVEHGRTGFVVKSCQPELLAQAMSRFIENRELVSEMGDRGRRRAAELFSLESFAEKFSNIMERRDSVLRAVERSIR